MKRIVLTFGLISGGILSLMMLATLPFIDRIGFDNSEVIGYTSMVAGFLMVFFGIRSYREQVGGGSITFGRGVAVGLLITAVASACYVATWEVIYYRITPDFADKYAAHALEKAQASGATPEQLAARREEMRQFKEMYRNPVVNSAITFLEPLPVGVLVTLVSAGVLRRRRSPDAAGGGAPHPAA